MNYNTRINPDTVEKWSSKFRNWIYYHDFIIDSGPDDGMGFQCVDCPLVYRIEGDDSWYMFYTAVGKYGRGIALITSKKV